MASLPHPVGKASGGGGGSEGRSKYAAAAPGAAGGLFSEFMSYAGLDSARSGGPSPHSQGSSSKHDFQFQQQQQSMRHQHQQPSLHSQRATGASPMRPLKPKTPRSMTLAAAAGAGAAGRGSGAAGASQKPGINSYRVAAAPAIENVLEEDREDSEEMSIGGTSNAPPAAAVTPKAMSPSSRFFPTFHAKTPHSSGGSGVAGSRPLHDSSGAGAGAGAGKDFDNNSVDDESSAGTLTSDTFLPLVTTGIHHRVGTLAPEFVGFSTAPVFIVLSKGVLYVYSRDPTRSTYFPYNPVLSKPGGGTGGGNNGSPSRGSASPHQQQSKQQSAAAVAAAAVRPPVELARVMLTEESVTTSESITPTTTTFYLHFHAPQLDSSSADDKLAVLFSTFSDIVPAKTFTIQLRSYSELRTWKAHIRAHINMGVLARRRINEAYIKTMLNKQLIGRKFPPKFFEANMVPQPVFKIPEKVHVRVESGLLCLYESKPTNTPQDTALVARTLDLSTCAVSLRTEPAKDNMLNAIITLRSALAEDTPASASASASSTASAAAIVEEASRKSGFSTTVSASTAAACEGTAQPPLVPRPPPSIAELGVAVDTPELQNMGRNYIFNCILRFFTRAKVLGSRFELLPFSQIIFSVVNHFL
jgi:hypothetical protein